MSTTLGTQDFLDDSHSMVMCQNCWVTFPERTMSVIAGQRLCPKCAQSQSQPSELGTSDPVDSVPVEGYEFKTYGPVEPQDVPHTAAVEPDGRNNAGKDTTDHGGQVEHEKVDAANIKRQRRPRDSDGKTNEE